MKKLLILFILCTPFFAKSQNLCLQTMCTAAHARVGDTVVIGAALTASNGYGSIAYKFQSGPATPVITAGTPYSPITGGATQVNAQITRLSAAGTYLFQVTSTDAKGNAAPPSIDSVVVAAAVICPLPRTVTGITITLYGLTITIPVSQGTKVTFSDGTTQDF
jgi:hypothetical protein